MADSIAAANPNNVNLPDYVRPELDAVMDDLALVQDLLAGTRRMQDKSNIYIRKWEDEETSVYMIRSKAEQVMEGLGRTLSASVGMLFAQPPNIEWNDASIDLQEQWENIDAAGTAGHVFIKRFTETAVRDGVALILVDHPIAPLDDDGEIIPINAETEIEFGLRPTWASYGRGNALSWLTDTLDNREVLTQLVLYEPTMVRKGSYGVVLVKRYRVLMLIEGQAHWVLFEAVEDSPSEESHFKSIGEGQFTNRKGEVANFLPVAIAHTGRSDSLLTATIPLLGVAWANLGHWQLSTNLRFYTDISSFPQPTIKGTLAPAPQAGGGPAAAGKLKLGPMVVVHVTGEGSEFSYTMPPTDGFEPIEKRVAQKERDMALMGLSFLAKDKRVQETAKAKELDATAENASLATSAQGIDDAVNQAFKYHGWFLGEEGEMPVFTLNRDFEATVMNPAVMAAYVTAVDRAGFPPRLLLQAWKDGGRIAPDIDLEELELEMLAIQAAKEAEAAEAREDALEAAKPTLEVVP